MKGGCGFEIYHYSSYSFPHEEIQWSSVQDKLVIYIWLLNYIDYLFTEILFCHVTWLIAHIDWIWYRVMKCLKADRMCVIIVYLELFLAWIILCLVLETECYYPHKCDVDESVDFYIYSRRIKNEDVFFLFYHPRKIWFHCVCKCQIWSSHAT